MMRTSRAFFFALVTGHSSTSVSQKREENVKIPGPSIDELPPYTPSASEAPELLLPYEEPKPFVSAKRLRVFLSSMFVGATTVGGSYYLFSKSAGKFLYNGENGVCLQRITESNRLALQGAQNIVPEFTAPSHFEELQEKIRLHERELRKQREQVAQESVMLHNEIEFRLKMWWNMSLTHLQEAAESLSRLLERQRERTTLAHVKRELDARGYEVLKLRSGDANL
ncbi:hypothetical protein ERJ75_001739900 [Trypanosoma vivax]|uniref:Transmembrane protein n=1 Tax=Trypanosoma vivax (strain Y486) TaxID=1055687 RepID=G0U2X5_TRYVY|nr:hypothetical protein TRVL_00891 [Trypanosoma vivax]KAH8604149.1 hypothetical protein ERJ75_001739900 [Trypanosoma vivax]CCC50629.1 conserved hypothetical protein [Trypanosoma vivax Y486]